MSRTGFVLMLLLVIGLVCAFAAGINYLRKARWWMLGMAVVSGAITFHVSQWRHPVVTVDGDRTTRLLRLPWNVEEDAFIWRGLIEEKLRP